MAKTKKTRKKLSSSLGSLLYDDEGPLGLAFTGTEEESTALSISDPRFLENLPGNTWRSKQMKAICVRVIDELGGLGTLSFLEEELCRRVAVLSVVGVEEDMKLAADSPIDFDKYMNLTKTQIQLFKILGIERKKLQQGKRTDTPTLAHYLAQKQKYDGRRGKRRKKQ